VIDQNNVATNSEIVDEKHFQL